MRIGLFTDTYRPSVNGIVYVVEILRHGLEQLGHEVFIFAPAPSIGFVENDDHIIRFPGFKGAFYDDYNASIFYPPRVVKKIKELDLDVLHFFTPGQVGMMAVYAAKKTGKPLVAEYCTDLFEYAEHYPQVLPGLVMLGALLPFTIKLSSDEVLELMRAGRPRKSAVKWSRSLIRHAVTLVHSHCDAVIAHSRKTLRQLDAWNLDEPYRIHIIPTGVDPIPKASKAELTAFRDRWGISPDDEVVLCVARLSAEKNLDMLIDMTAELIKKRPNARMLYVGDFEYRPVLEAKAKASPAAHRITFTGTIPRENLGQAYGIAKLFVFPSLTDTQGLVIHEAAQAGLPIVLIDEPVSEIVKDSKNGYISENDPVDMATKVARIIEDPERRKAFSDASKKLAGQYSEAKQCKKIADLYESLVAESHE